VPLSRPTQPFGNLATHRECAGSKPSTTARRREGGHRSERPPRRQMDYRVVVVPPTPQKHRRRRSKKRRSSAKRECERRPGEDSHGDKETGDGRLRRRRRRQGRECRERDRGGRQTRCRRDGSASDPPYLARPARVRGRLRQARAGGGGAKWRIHASLPQRAHGKRGRRETIPSSSTPADAHAAARR